MKNKKFLTILGVVVAIYFIGVMIYYFVARIPDKKREQKAIQIEQVMNDSSLSIEERDKKLQELYGFSDNETIIRDGLEYKLINKSSFEKASNEEFQSLISKLKYYDYEYKKSDGTITAHSTDNKTSRSKHHNMSLSYENKYGNKKMEISIDDIPGTKFSMSNYKEFDDLLDALKIDSFNLDTEINNLNNYNDKIIKNLNSGWNVTICILDSSKRKKEIRESNKAALGSLIIHDDLDSTIHDEIHFTLKNYK